MGLYGMMRTSASGMAAQANRLATVADNIANSSTTGYKRASTEFSSLILESGGSGVHVGQRRDARALRASASRAPSSSRRPSPTWRSRATASSSCRATRPDQTFLTRAGSFVQDGDGNLVNAAGYKLMGYSLARRQPQRRLQRHRRTVGRQSRHAGAASQRRRRRARCSSTCRRTRRSTGRRPAVGQCAPRRPTAARPRSSPTTTSATR